MMYIVLAATSVMTLLVLMQRISSKRKVKLSSSNSKRKDMWNYKELREMLQSQYISLPAMIIDLDAFEDNVKVLVNIARKEGKRLRIATKSVRCLELIRRIGDIGAGVVNGYMCYSIMEAEFLYKEGLDDFYVPYPTVQLRDIEKALDMTEKGAIICLTVDCVEHVEKIDQICAMLKESKKAISDPIKLKVAIDLDMSFKIGPIHLGAHRSDISSVDVFASICKKILKSEHLLIWGAMGYEASVAGLPDDSPFSPLPNSIIRYLKDYFYKIGSDLRGEALKWCFKNNIELNFFNGGGTGNLAQVSEDHAVTEVTAGSGFLQGQLFDYYVANMCQPACCFALQCTRIKPKYLCCQSGGFVASGALSMDKYPMPFANPYSLRAYKDEGFGEVQTPLEIISKDDDEEICLGDPVFFRPAKSGEIAEHFNEYILKRDYAIEKIVPTYRGQGHVFY